MVFTYILTKMGRKLLEVIRDEADRELYPDESQIRERLIGLQMLLEAEQIGEQEYEEQESRLMTRWRQIQENKEED